MKTHAPTSPFSVKSTRAVLCRCCLTVVGFGLAFVSAGCSSQRARAAALHELQAAGVIAGEVELESKRMPDGATLLIDAAERGDVAAVRRLLTAGADPDGRGYKVNSVPLTRVKSAEVLELLLKSGADVNAVDAVGTTPLGWAVGLGKMENVRCLLQAGADVCPEPPATPPLLQAVNLGMAAQLLAAGADVNQASATEGTPLMRAAALGNRELAELYLGLGADANARDGRGNTALHVARTVAMVDLLKSNGADPSLLNHRGETPLFEIMHSAAMVRALVAAGVPLDVVSAERKMTALQVMLADNREDDEAILALIAAGADVKGCTPGGQTTVQQAAARGGRKRWAIIRALIRAGAETE